MHIVLAVSLSRLSETYHNLISRSFAPKWPLAAVSISRAWPPLVRLGTPFRLLSVSISPQAATF